MPKKKIEVDLSVLHAFDTKENTARGVKIAQELEEYDREFISSVVGTNIKVAHEKAKSILSKAIKDTDEVIL